MKLSHSNTPFQFMLHLYYLSECLGQVTLYFFLLKWIYFKRTWLSSFSSWENQNPLFIEGKIKYLFFKNEITILKI